VAVSKQIDLVPLGGLGNRMRAVASAVRLCQNIGAKLHIYWRKSPECSADFEELFEPISLPFVYIHRFKAWQFYLRPSLNRNLHLPGVVRSLRYDCSLLVESDCLDNDLSDSLVGERIYICSGHSLAQHYPVSELFVPRVAILERIERIRSTFPDEVIGVHIRRQDNKISIEKAPEQAFIRAMDVELVIHPDVQFFLATDDAALKSRLIDRYGKHLVSQDIKLNRHSLQGMENAVVDLWSLASTQKIIGSPHSSFSGIAQELSGIKVIQP
jgi:hypothetical protein